MGPFILILNKVGLNQRMKLIWLIAVATCEDNKENEIKEQTTAVKSLVKDEQPIAKKDIFRFLVRFRGRRRRHCVRRRRRRVVRRRRRRVVKRRRRRFLIWRRRRVVTRRRRRFLIWRRRPVVKRRRRRVVRR